MTFRNRLIAVAACLAVLSLACTVLTGLPEALTPTPAATFTPLPPRPVEPGIANPDEPVFITGEIPYTSPFFLNSISEPFILLEDEAGFVRRDREFKFNLAGQAIGPVEVHPDQSLTYSLALPAIPQGTQVDVDNDGNQNTGVQVFAIAYWSNTWGGPFLEKRDGTGWSNAYVSTITDPENHDEIKGGILIVWAPDDKQAFPTSFGKDGLLFTADDPTAPIPAGYNIVELNQEPFRTYKEARPQISLIEGEVAVNDFSKLSYREAFEAFFKKASAEYPFTVEKRINWQELHDKFAPQIEDAKNKRDFYQALHEFSLAIPDQHIGLSLDPQIFFEEKGGSFGLVLAELSDGKVIVTHVLPGTAGEKAGIRKGAEITRWDNQAIGDAINQVVPYFNPYSTEHARRLGQLVFLTRVPPGTKVSISYKNPGDTSEKSETLTAEVEYDSLFKAISGFNEDALFLPIESQVLEESGLGYIRLTSLNDDYVLLAKLWERAIKKLIDNKVPGLIIDLRSNGGGNPVLGFDFIGYFFDKAIDLYTDSYYNNLSGKFEPSEVPKRIEPGPLNYQGQIAVLVSPDCVSACEGFAYAIRQEGRAIIVGHYPTAGAYGEVGRGQYKFPGDFELQIPTGKSFTPDGKLMIEGVGVIPDITVPITETSALGQEDAVLKAAIQALLEKLK